MESSSLHVESKLTPNERHDPYGEETKGSTSRKISGAKDHRYIQSEAKANTSTMNTPTREFSPVNDRRVAPITKKQQQRLAAKQKRDPIVVVESHKKYTQIKA